MGSVAVKEISFVAKMLFCHLQGDKCYMCGREIIPRFYYGVAAPTVDHVHPRKEGRRAKMDAGQLGNHAIACGGCNGDKGDRPPTPCEILYLFALNRRLGLPEERTERWDQAQGKCHHARVA